MRFPWNYRFVKEPGPYAGNSPMTRHHGFHVAHATPRRLRLQAPHKRGDREFFRSVQDQLSQWPDVERVDVNPLSTSVVIHAPDAGAILDLLESSGMLRAMEAPVRDERNEAPQPKQPSAKPQAHLQRRSPGRLNMARISVFAVVGASVAFKLARGNNVAAAAMVLFYGGRAAQRWWVSYQEGQRAGLPLQQFLPPSGGR